MIADEPIVARVVAGTPAKSRLIGRRVHPAVEIVRRTQAVWRDHQDEQVAVDRAKLIVQRLIELGWIRGQMQCDLSFALDEDVKPGRESAMGPFWKEPVAGEPDRS